MLRGISLSLLLVFLTACETAEGIGRDIQTGGEAIEDASNDVQNGS